MTIEATVSCINKTDRQNPWERIRHIGGKNPNGSRWRLSQTEAISGIERGTYTFYVGGAVSTRVLVVVRTSQHGNKYLTTEADGLNQNNLLSLPECP